METSLSKHINKLNKLSYKDQCEYIKKKISSIKPDDIVHLTFLKKLQIILTDLPNNLDYLIKKSHIGYEGGLNYCFNSNMFDDYFGHVIEARIPFYCRRLTKDEYLVTIPIKFCSDDILTTIKINNNNGDDN